MSHDDITTLSTRCELHKHIYLELNNNICANLLNNAQVHIDKSHETFLFNCNSEALIVRGEFYFISG